LSRPSESDLRNAGLTCNDLAAFIAETEPHATHDIGVLEEAANILSAFVEFPEGDDE
jgi:hypothetical protein